MFYDERNRKNLSKLADHTKIAAMKWYEYCVKNDIEILIYSTIRTEEEQAENVRTGKSQTMKSFHLVGQALDFVPADGPRIDWNAYKNSNIKQAVAEAKRLGFDWGGDWKSFIDRPHLQYNYKGYGTDTFGKYVETKPVVKREEPKVAERDINKVSKWAKKDWEEAIANGYFDGSRPGAPITREEAAVVINRLRQNFFELINQK